jgi:TfoX/Sxy family transcriptional regulator of competence genes
MAYEEELADRIRELLGGERRLSEKKMFGGLAFLIGGNMAIAASGQGGLLVRVDPAQSEKLVATSNARLMEMRGRQMQGWLRVDTEDVPTKRQLARWVRIGAEYARSLPPKYVEYDYPSSDAASRVERKRPRDALQLHRPDVVEGL